MCDTGEMLRDWNIGNCVCLGKVVEGPFGLTADWVCFFCFYSCCPKRRDDLSVFFWKGVSRDPMTVHTYMARRMGQINIRQNLSKTKSVLV